MPKHLRLALLLLTCAAIVACKNRIPAEKETTHEMDGLEKAMVQEFKMTRDPQLNVIPNERLETARAYMKDLMSQIPNSGRTTALAWQERGPRNIGGRTRAMIVDKRDATGNTVFAGSVSGGMFKTTNFTSTTPTWTVVNDFFPNLAVTAMIQDNTNQDIMYAGTGEGWFNIDAVKGAGIYKTTDGGQTWTRIPSTATFEYIQDLAIDNNGNLYASMRNLQSANRGVQRSTDGGVTWVQVLGAPLINPSTGQQFPTGRAADLEVASNGDIYASLGLVGAAVTNRSIVMKSAFALHGANTGALGNWVEVTPNTPTITQRTEILVAPSNPQIVYLLMQDSATHQVLNVFRSSNSGVIWTTLPAPAALNNGLASQTWFNLIGVVDPNNADILIVGGLQLARSTNGGASWTTISNSPSVHVDQHFLQFMGSNSLYIGNDGGAYYSNNIDAATPTYSNKNVGYNVTQFYSCDLHPSNANYFLGGTQDNGSQKLTSAGIGNAQVVSGGDGGFAHIDQTDGLLQITAFTNNNYRRSVDGGNAFTTLTAVNNNRGQFINPTDLDDNAKILYCGDDAGQYYMISGLNAVPSGQIVSVPTMGAREVTAVKVDPSAANTIYIGASFGNLVPQILKLSNANTTSPTLLSTGNVGTVANASISSIDVDPSNNNHLVVTLSNYGVTSVWESTNGGGTFTSIEGNLPDMPIRWAIFAPPNAQLNGASGGNGGIILGTELGVWTTSQLAGAATTWIANNDGLANVRIDMLRYRPSDNLLLAGTHGRGLYTTTIPTVVTGVPNVPITKDFIKYISSENNTLHIVKGTLQTRTMTVQLMNMQGQVVYKGQHRYENTSLDLGKFQKGIYIVRITGDKRENFIQQFLR